MNKQQSLGVETINSFITSKGIQRTLQVEIDGNNIDIDFTVKNENATMTHSINLNRRETLTLVFYLIRILLPNKFLANKWQNKKEEEKEA